MYEYEYDTIFLIGSKVFCIKFFYWLILYSLFLLAAEHVDVLHCMRKELTYM